MRRIGLEGGMKLVFVIISFRVEKKIEKRRKANVGTKRIEKGNICEFTFMIIGSK